MYIKVSKRFATYCNKVAKKSGIEFHAEVLKMTEGQYLSIFPDGWATTDFTGDGYNVLHVSYPWHYYACPIFMSTEMLTDEFRRRRVKTENDLQEMIIKLFEI